MSEAESLRGLRLGTVGAALLLGLFEVTQIGRADLPILFCLTVLAALASAVRLRIQGDEVGFETVIAFPALILFHQPAMAILPVLVGALSSRMIVAFGSRSSTLDAAYGAAQSTVMIFVASFLYSTAIPADAAVLVRASGYIVLILGSLLTGAVFALLADPSDGRDPRVRLRAVLASQGKVLLLTSPIVAVEVMSYYAYGISGFSIAFLPLLLVAHVMKGATDAGHQSGDLARRNRELELLTESSTQLLRSESAAQSVEKLAEVLSNIILVRAATVVTWETADEAPFHVFRFGACAPSDQTIARWAESVGFPQKVPKEPLVIPAAERQLILFDKGAAYQVIVGIQTIEVIHGVLIVETDDRRILQPEVLALLGLLVDQTAISLQDQLLKEFAHSETRKKSDEVEIRAKIIDVATWLINAYDVDQILSRVAETIRTALRLRKVMITLRDPSSGQYINRAQAGFGDEWEEVRRQQIPVQEITRLFAQRFRVSKSFFVSQRALRDGEEIHRSEDWHILDRLMVPIGSGEDVRGYIVAHDPENGKVPSYEMVQNLELLGTLVVTALQTAEHYAEIKRLTIVDSLTSAFNHRHFQDALRKEIQRHHRNNNQLAVAMIDIDDFKRVNDTFGHQIGDEVLKRTVAVFKETVREVDIVARYGGEEFAIVFPETPIHRAFDAGERLRKALEQSCILLPQIPEPIQVTISIGISAFPKDGFDSSELIARADEALYHAKKQGKNRVVVFHQPNVEVPVV